MSKPIVAAAEELIWGNTNDLPTPIDRGHRPHIVLPGKAPGGDPCVGFSFCIFPNATGGAPGAPVVTPPTVPAGGLTVQPYRLIPTVGMWASFAEYTGYQLGQQLVCYDFGAGTALYFKVTGASVDGEIVMAVAALS